MPDKKAYITREVFEQALSDLRQQIPRSSSGYQWDEADRNGKAHLLAEEERVKQNRLADPAEQAAQPTDAELQAIFDAEAEAAVADEGLAQARREVERVRAELHAAVEPRITQDQYGSVSGELPPEPVRERKALYEAEARLKAAEEYAQYTRGRRTETVMAAQDAGAQRRLALSLDKRALRMGARAQEAEAARR